MTSSGRGGVAVGAVLALACVVLGVIELATDHRAVRGAGLIVVGAGVLLAVTARASRS